jgi:hypothetical protein
MKSLVSPNKGTASIPPKKRNVNGHRRSTKSVVMFVEVRTDVTAFNRKYASITSAS